jgi:hypothetical protein
MAKAPTPAAAPARTAVTLTGVALLAAIAASENGYMMLTQAEGQDIVNEGFAVVDTSIVEGDTAAVRLTEAGTAKLAETKDNGGNPEATAGTASAADSAKASYDIDDGVPMPTGTVRRGREGGYPFDKLEIGQSFHVAKTADNEDPAARLASSVSGARVKYSEEIPGETETVTKKTYKRGPDGKGYAKDADGKRIVESEETVTVPKLKLTRDFVCKSVDASDPKGEGARVWRVALTA